MHKKFLILLFILILAIIFGYAFSASYSSHNIDKLAYVIALGIDSSENDNLKVTFQFTKYSVISEEGSSGEDSTVENTVEASSIDSAINLLKAYMRKEINLSHCKIIVFSEEIAKKGISTQIYSLINNQEIRPTTNIIISKCDAKDYIADSKPVLDKLSTRYYETFSVSSDFTGYTANLTLGDFYNRLVCKTCNATAILGYTDSSDSSSSDSSSSSDQSSITGKNTSKNFGIAVFREDKFVGELTSLESVAHLLIANDIDLFVISVKNPSSSDSYIDLAMSQSKDTKISVDIINGSPYICVELFVTGKILTLDENSDYSQENVLSAINQVTNSYMEDLISSYLYKTSKEYKSDIDGFGKFALKAFLTTDKWEDYDWHSKYKDSIFKVKVNTNIESSLLLTNS